jgi:membrane protein YqaA with SNARE-associated domain
VNVAHLVLYGTALVFGIGSGVLPVFLNAEAYVIALGSLVDSKTVLIVAILVLVVGTVVGKIMVFELARRGSLRYSGVERRDPRNGFTAWLRRTGDRMLRLLEHKYLGAATVLASSATGVPPLAVVAVMAGVARQPLWLFCLMVFTGRAAQFLAIALVLHGVT